MLAQSAERTRRLSQAGPSTGSTSSLEAGPFVLRPLFKGVPLSADGTSKDIKINCVDYLDQNLYVGTSASELLHFVQIPPDPADKDGTPVFILASRLRPAYSEASAGPNSARPGVQQILLLPRVGKACVLCNWTVTFYSLPELSPVFGTTQVKNCNWIGGVDLNEEEHADSRSQGVTILLSLNRRIQVVKIGDDARVVKKIDFAGSTLSVRRDNIACVADSRSYALLDVDRQLKIPLMSISSFDNSQPGGVLGQAQSLLGGPDGSLSRSASTATARGPGDAQSHSRSTSLGNFMGGNSRRRPAEHEDPVFQEPDPPPAPSPPAADQGDTAKQTHDEGGKPLPSLPTDAAATTQAQPATSTSNTATPARVQSPPKPGPVFLKPHILSPTAEEFLLVTGTAPLEPGIGLFVNLDGDPTRPTLEFERYPREVVVDGGSSHDPSSSRASLVPEEDGYVIASTTKELENGVIRHGLEIQRFDMDVGVPEREKFWLERPVSQDEESIPLGIRSLLHTDEIPFQELIDRLCQRRFSPFPSEVAPPATMSLRSVDSRTDLSIQRQSKEKELFERDLESDEEPLPEGWLVKRNTEEEDFVRRLAKTKSRIAIWAGSDIWWAARNPLLVQLEAGIESAHADGELSPQTEEQRKQLFTIINSIRGRDARTELEFITFSYIRQKAGAMLLMSFLNSPFSEPEQQAMEEVLLEGGLDPRVALALVPALRNEIVESRKGIWIYGGIKDLVDGFISDLKMPRVSPPVSSLPPEVLQFLRRFLASWRKKKGFGSVADESEVFKTVDAALLLVLLELDQSTPSGTTHKQSPLRAELYDVVDRGVDCYDRAVDLLETYHRLFVLSRLYQKHKMSADVLATWQRIIEGERDAGGEFKDGEQQVRTYLSNIRNQALVQEYAVWLAARNPKLGVQVFTDDKSKAPKFQPAEVVEILRDEAPDAVKYYLEHLVFGKGNTAYVNELITYYLDIVIHDLQTSPASRETMAAMYEAYRALRPPKPTYRQFLTDNAPSDDEVWHSRLRLLQLLGCAHDYDAEAIQSRINTALPAAGADAQLLVPETIILDGRARRHDNALQLLVHRLGDYDTAVSYCLRGGASIYTPSSGRRDSAPTTETQTRLFRVLLGEFLTIGDLSDRVEQTGALLERFGGWFDVLEVLELIPDSWSVDVAAGFLVTSLRRLVRERHESIVARALSSAENLRVNYDLLVKIDEKGPVFDTGQEEEP